MTWKEFYDLCVAKLDIHVYQSCYVCNKQGDAPFCLQHNTEFINSNSSDSIVWAYEKYKSELVKNSINIWSEK